MWAEYPLLLLRTVSIRAPPLSSSLPPDIVPVLMFSSPHVLPPPGFPEGASLLSQTLALGTQSPTECAGHPRGPLPATAPSDVDPSTPSCPLCSQEQWVWDVSPPCEKDRENEARNGPSLLHCQSLQDAGLLGSSSKSYLPTLGSPDPLACFHHPHI